MLPVEYRLCLLVRAVRLATQWSRVRFPTTARMGDRLWADKPPQYFTKPARLTQPPTLSGAGNEYQPSEVTFCGPGVKAGLFHFGSTYGCQVNCIIPC